MNDPIVRDIVKKYWKQLRKKKNVLAYSGTLKPREKIVAGKKITIPNTECFVVYVMKKESPMVLSIDDLVPRTIEGIETDVREHGPMKALSVKKVHTKPVMAGVSAMNGLVNGGCTLGWFGIDNETDKLGIVDNAHCGGRECKAKKGEPYIYPSPIDGGNILEHKISEHERHVPLHYDNYKCKYRNTVVKLYRTLFRTEVTPTPVDISLELVTIPYEDIKLEVAVMGQVLGWRRGTIGELGEKSGRTTCHTTGAILKDNDWYGLVQYRRGTVYCGPSALWEKRGFCSGGDSSSLIRWMSDKFGQGFLYAGSDTHTLSCHYDLVQEHLNTKLLTSLDII